MTSPAVGVLIEFRCTNVKRGSRIPLDVLESSSTALLSGVVVPIPTEPNVVTLVTEELPS